MPSFEKLLPWQNQRNNEPYESLVAKSDDDESDGTAQNTDRQRNSIVWRRAFNIFPWVLCVLLSIFLAFALFDRARQHEYGSYEHGFDTDMSGCTFEVNLSRSTCD